MAYRHLDRSGQPSARNKAKGYRPPRLIKDKEGNESYHPLDMMKYAKEDEYGRPTGETGLSNTTGCFGNVSTWGIGFISVVKRTKGRDKRPRKRKNVCKLYQGRSWVDFDRGSKSQLRNLRSNLLTYKIMLDSLYEKTNNRRFKVHQNLTSFIGELTKHLGTVMNSQELETMFKSDRDRELSTRGMMQKSDNFSVEPIKSLNQRIARAIVNIRTKNRSNSS